jgi:hypothetical protein
MSAKRLGYGDLYKQLVKSQAIKAIDSFAVGLVEDESHPVVTGLSRGNWTSSVNSKKISQNTYGYGWNEIADAYDSRTTIISLSDAKETVRDFFLGMTWNLGDTVYWTNSLDYIADLEVRRKFFDVIVGNAAIKAQATASRGG